MTVGKFIPICEKEGIIWNNIIHIRILRAKNFFGFFRKLTGITIEGALNSSSICVEIMAADDNGKSIMHDIDCEDIIAVKLNSS